MPVWNVAASFTVARGTADRVPDSAPNEAALFELGLVGNAAGSAVRMRLSAACATGLCTQLVPAPLTFPHRATVELHVGEGAEGRLLYWAGDDTSGPPTATLENLDNAAWRGIERVSLGITDAGEGVPAAFGGESVVFDAVTTSDLNLFWSDFETGAGHAVASNMTSSPLTGGAHFLNTCGGSNALPVLASGSVRMRGPTLIRPFTITPSMMIMPWINIGSDMPGLQAFVCEAGVSTTSRCTKAVKMDQIMQVGQRGSYQLVIGDVDGGCGPFTLWVNPLGAGE